MEKAKKLAPSNDAFIRGAGVSFIRNRLILSTDKRLVDNLLSEDAAMAEIIKFLCSDGPRRLIFFHQVRNVSTFSFQRVQNENGFATVFQASLQNMPTNKTHSQRQRHELDCTTFVSICKLGDS
jgi:hypothetical protein